MKWCVVCAQQEFSAQLKKLTDGDVSLVDKLGSYRLALQAAMANAVRTPEVIRMFASKQPASLRARLAALSEDRKLGRITEDRFKCAVCGCAAVCVARPSLFPKLARRDHAVEVIVALKKLGEELTPGEMHILETSDDAMRQFESADKAIGAGIRMCVPLKSVR
jgi:hypothetical protein